MVIVGYVAGPVILAIVIATVVVVIVRRDRSIDDGPLAALMEPEHPSGPTDHALAVIAYSNAFRPAEPPPFAEDLWRTDPSWPERGADPPAAAARVEDQPRGPGPPWPFERDLLNLTVVVVRKRAQTRLEELASADPPEESGRAESGSARDWALVRLVLGGAWSLVESAAVLSDLGAAGHVAFDSGQIVPLEGRGPDDGFHRAALAALRERALRSGRIRLVDCLGFVSLLRPGPGPEVADEAAEVWARLRSALDSGTCPDRRTAVLVRLLRIETYTRSDKGLFRHLRRHVGAKLDTPGLDEGDQQVAVLFDRELPRVLGGLWAPGAGGV